MGLDCGLGGGLRGPFVGLCCGLGGGGGEGSVLWLLLFGRRHFECLELRFGMEIEICEVIGATVWVEERRTEKRAEPIIIYWVGWLKVR